MKHEDNDPTWNLIRDARPTKVSNSFSRNVLREIRKLEAEPDKGGWLTAFLGRPALILGAAATCALALFAASKLNPGSSNGVASENSGVPAEAQITIEELDSELEEIEYFDELLAVQDAGTLSDEDIDALFF